MCTDHVVTFLSQRAIRWTSNKAKESHVARRDVSVQDKESPEKRARERAKGRRPGPCLLCQGPHWARDCPSHHGGKGKRTVSSGKGYKNSSPFRQAYLEGDRRDWITGAGANGILFPSLQNFASFDLQGKFILDSGATMSMGGVDLLQKFQEIDTDAGLQLTSHPVPPLHFSLFPTCPGK